MSRSERVARDTSERSRWRRLPKLSEGVSVQKRSGTAAHAWRQRFRHARAQLIGAIVCAVWLCIETLGGPGDAAILAQAILAQKSQALSHPPAVACGTTGRVGPGF